MNTLPPEPDPVPLTPPTAAERVTAAFDRLAEVDRPELWTTLRAPEDVLVDAKAVDERVKAGESLPLAGTVTAVHDLVDTAPEPAATVVARLSTAGAVVLGKTTLDRFAASSARDRTKIASSTAAVAVALGIVDFALGADTPVAAAALNAVVGLKPTPGLLPCTGAPHGVTLFAAGLAPGSRALALMAGPDEIDPGARPWPANVRLGAGEHPRVAVPDDTALEPLCAAARYAFTQTVARLRAAGAVVTPIAAPGSFATQGFDALLLPSVPDHPDITEALADPAGVSRRLATYSGFTAGRAAVTVPVLPGDLRPFGVTFVTRAFEDQIGLDLAAVCTDEPLTPFPEPGADVVVFGAHLRGQPLNARLVELGARFTRPVRTAERYRMVLLRTELPQPGIVEGGSALDGECWRLSPAAFDEFARTLPEPLVVGPVQLEDGSAPPGVRCDPAAAEGAAGLERYESWRGYLRFASTAGLRGPG